MERPAELIEQLRLERGLTQAQACTRGELPPATWSMVESGFTANPHPTTKLRIARALGVAPSSIWRARPRPLHLEDVEDPRWMGAVQRMAGRLEREGSPQERRRFGDRLIAVLDHADAGCGDDGDVRWDELWERARSLVLDPERAPIEIVGGRLVERGSGEITPASRRKGIAARRSRGIS
ncbi:MAG TPA: helix-turn-helix transcriptional regulator [Solirubrobacteraceae bacterium]|jgi:transcriptional regulator with XRE-family HTH domain|nr:helix-turn-helix transcriptional regulator [Solirubrobacteraceae bacterium]